MGSGHLMGYNAALQDGEKSGEMDNGDGHTTLNVFTATELNTYNG